MDAWLWCLVLMLAGLAILVLDIFLPSHGVLLALGGLVIAAALVVAFLDGLKTGAFALFVLIVVLPLLGYWAVVWWPYSPVGRRILNKPPGAEQEFSAVDPGAERLKTLIGRRGVARGRMLPAGRITLEGQTYNAVSLGMPIDPGQVVQVVGVRLGHTLVVRPAAAWETAAPPDKPPTDAPAADLLEVDPFREPLA